MIHVVEGYDLLVELEEVDFVGPDRFDLLLVCGLGSVDKPDACLGEVVGHGELRISIEADVLVLLVVLSVHSTMLAQIPSVFTHTRSTSSPVVQTSISCVSRVLQRIRRVRIIFWVNVALRLLLSVHHLVEQDLVYFDI